MNRMRTMLNKFWEDESGQDLIEYALVAGLVGLSCIAAMGSLSGSLVNNFTTVGNALTSSV